MRKIISRILIILIVFLILFDFVFASQIRCAYAAGPSADFLVGIGNLATGLVAIVYTLLKALIVGITYGVQVLVTVTASSYGLNEGKFWSISTALDPITPIDIFFNKYKLTGINFFDFEGIEENSFIYLFRLSVAQWYTIMKLIAIAILLVILIYVGIRMALSTIADDKAKYKKMLVDWVVGLLLIFVLQYIIIFTIYCNDAIVKALETAFADSELSSFVSKSVVGIGVNGILDTGILSFASVLVYIFIVFQTIIFLLAYMKRMVKIGFLIMISPLITITYSIDKMGDGKAQALGNWLKEFVYTILIQPFHCIIYLALAQTALELLKTEETLTIFDSELLNSGAYNQLAAAVLAILCLKFVNDGEQIVRKIFGFKDEGDTGMAAGAALGVAALMNAKKIGGATRKSINNIKGKGQKLATALKHDLGKGGGASIKFKKMTDALSKTKLGKGASKIAEKASSSKTVQAASKLGNKAINAGKDISSKVSNAKKFVGSKKTSLAEKVKQSKIGGVASKVKGAAIKGANSNIGKYIRSKSNLSTALGIMGAAMVYSSGGNSAMQAIAAGSAIKSGTQELFGSSNRTVSNDNEDLHDGMEEYAHSELIDSKIDDKNPTAFSQSAKEAILAYAALDNLKAQKEAKAKEIEEAKNVPEGETVDTAKIEGLEQEIQHLDEQIKENENIINEKDAEGYLAGYEDEQGELHRYTDDTDSFNLWKEKAEERFDSEREMRFRAAMSAPNKKRLDDLKNQIIQKLRAAKVDSKGQTGNTTLTIDEEETISSTAQALIDNISLGVLSKKGFGQEAQKELIASKLGLKKDGDNQLFKGMDEFFKVTDEYTNYERQNAIAQNYAHVKSYDETGLDIATESLLHRELSSYSKKGTPKTGKTAKES